MIKFFLDDISHQPAKEKDRAIALSYIYAKTHVLRFGHLGMMSKCVTSDYEPSNVEGAKGNG